MITLTGFADEISPDLEVQLDVLASEGISHIEFRGVWDKNVLKLTDDELARVKERLDARGFKVSSIGSPIGKIKITDSFEPHMEDFKRAIYVAKYFSAPFIRIFSFFIPEGDDPTVYREEVLSRMKQLTRLAEQEGVQLLHENEKDIYGDTGERCQEIFLACDSSNLRGAFDPANYVQCGVSPMTEAYPLVAPYIAYYHIKDALTESRKVVPAGEGDGQLQQLVQVLREQNFNGFLSLEPHLSAAGPFQGFSGPELFVVAVKALKKLLVEAHLEWN
ncbi:Sugar phosphate isomerase/epimerase [Paenibacillus sp. yr247]|uniref:sugar phosphate isomerase/epimerase family protein n=1 Tax=Paenibacillus sp. yr247 TaxID=1761880 RepID=UPI00089056A3|nr:sugar phosphate isomerase/epimerase family protein [Paenibacillus sp. yr247]SDO03704.1 Sugar phosphate isomerase/epimerase [Paenibacillus sp. yr247]